ncbi:MAG: hypothetical protein ABIO02_01030 [Patescibacteria group bacterium]
MKTLVTHISPDMDAATSVWLILKYLPGWKDAQLAFVPTGSTLNGMQPDADPDIIHVDTGLGKFDHHQFKAELSASLIIFRYLRKNNHIPHYDVEALERLATFVNKIDNFGEVYFPDATADVYDFTIYQLVEGLKPTMPGNEDLIHFVSSALEGILQVLKNKIRAEKEIPQGMDIETSWGKALVIESKNEELVKLAQKKGYKLVARRDPVRGFIRIKCIPDDKYDLSKLHERILETDKTGTWFLHASKHMLLNGSSKNPDFFKPSSLKLQDLIELIREI